MKYFKLLLLGILILTGTALYAVGNINNNEELFNVLKANKTFDAISLKLSTQNLKIQDLQAAVDQLLLLQEQATTCVSVATTKIAEIQKILNSVDHEQKTKSTHKDYKYFLDKKDNYNKQLASCRLFIFRSQEAVNAYKETILNMSTSKLLHHSLPIWQSFTFNNFSQLKNINFKGIYQQSGLSLLDHNEFYLLGIILILVFIVTMITKSISKNILTDDNSNKDHRLINSLLITLYRHSISIVISATFSLFFAIKFYGIDPNPNIENLFHSVFILMMIISGLKFLYLLAVQNKSEQLTEHVAKRFYHQLVLISWILLVAHILSFVFNDNILANDTIEIFQTAFVTFIAILVVLCARTFIILPFISNNKSLRIFTKLILNLFLIFTICAEWVGYHRLAAFLIQSCFTTILIIFSTIFVLKIIETILSIFDVRVSKYANKVRYLFGLNDLAKLNELILTRIGLYILLIFSVALLLLYNWGLTKYQIDVLITAFVDGVSFSGIHITPSRIVIALFLFTLIQLVGRFITGFITRHYQLQEEKDTQVAIASILTYFIFMIALILSLIIAGVNFTGLAIIAGALSVGIGLGLQNIVNNFVSGVVLLLEKPIKPGDRINIGDIEGYVKKIRIRSTQISTLAREDVIVPNSDLINNNVTNFMFRDKYWRISCKVGVAYGSDIQLVKKVLLEVAQENNDVVKNFPNEPRVLFQEFADSSLNFELWCIIYDVNKKYNIISDMNFAIDAAFRQNNITIAFPQRDIHIIKDKNITDDNT